MTRPARRGDLVVVEETTVTHMIGARSAATTRYTVAVVTSVTRDGAVKSLREDHRAAGTGAVREVRRMGPRVRLLTFPKDQIDVAAAQQAARDHTWPGGQPSRPFDTLDEVRDALRPFLRQSATA
jgi:hypothetical protein